MTTTPTAAASAPTATDPAPRTGPIVTILAATGVLVSLAQTLVVPIIGSLPQIFDAPTTDTAWVVTVTLLTGAIFTPILGRLGDLYGKKRVLLIALVPFILGSLLAALAIDLPMMIVGRGLQGIATGAVPLGITVIHDLLPREKAGAAIALMSSSLGIGGALGIPIAAAVTGFLDWRVLFWASAALGLVVVGLIARIIPARPAKTAGERFDYVGSLGLATGLVCLLLAVSKGNDWRWGSPAVLGLFAGAVVVLVAWGFYELRRPAPLVDLRTTVRAPVLITNLASILVGFAMYAQSLVVPQVLQLPVELGGLGQTMLQMGLWMAPAGLGMALMSKPGAAITRRLGAKWTLAIGAAAMAAGYGLAALSVGNPWTLVIATFIASCGTGFAFGAQPAIIMASVPASEKAAANGFNSLMRSFGTTACAAIIGIVLAATAQHVGGHEINTHEGFVIALLIGAGVALGAAVLAAVMPINPKATGSAH